MTARKAEKQNHFMNDVIKRYTVNVAHDAPFKDRLKAYENFHDPENESIAQIADEYKERLLGDEAEGTLGIIQKPYQLMQELFQYDKTTRTTKKEKLDEKEVEKIWDLHIEQFLEGIAGAELDKVREDYKGDKKGYQKHVRKLYDQVTKRGDRENPSIEAIIKMFTESEMGYRQFRDKYKQIVETEVGRMTSITSNYVTDHLIHDDKDRFNMATTIEDALKDHPTYEAAQYPLSVGAEVNAKGYLGLKFPEMTQGVKPEDLMRNHNIKTKRRREQNREEHH